MSEAKKEQTTNFFRYTWEEEQVQVTLSRVRDGREAPTAELLIASTAPGQPSHLLGPDRINLTSRQAKSSVIKSMSERYPQRDWFPILEQAFTLTLRAHRQGEPIRRLDEVVSVEPLFYRLSPLLLESLPTVVWGPAGGGKSTLAELFAVLISEGLVENSFKLEPEPGHVLYVDYETSFDEIQERAIAIMRGLGLSHKPSFHYQFMADPIQDKVEELSELIMEHNIHYMIVDSLGLACGGNPEQSDLINPYFRALRSLKVGTLSLHHPNREGKYYGNVYIQNNARAVYELTSSQEIDGLHIGLFNRKRNRGKLTPNTGFHLTFEEARNGGLERIAIQREDVRSVAGVAEGMSIRERVMAELRGGAVSPTDLSASLSGERQVSAETIRSILNKGKNTTFVQIGDGRWGLLQR